MNDDEERIARGIWREEEKRLEAALWRRIKRRLRYTHVALFLAGVGFGVAMVSLWPWELDRGRLASLAMVGALVSMLITWISSRPKP